MGQKKGQTGNPQGRPKGTPNKVTSEIKNWFLKIVRENTEQLETDLQQLEPKERLDFFTKIFPYIVAKREGTKYDNRRGLIIPESDWTNEGEADYIEYKQHLLTCGLSTDSIIRLCEKAIAERWVYPERFGYMEKLEAEYPNEFKEAWQKYGERKMNVEKDIRARMEQVEKENENINYGTGMKRDLFVEDIMFRRVSREIRDEVIW